MSEYTTTILILQFIFISIEFHLCFSYSRFSNRFSPNHKRINNVFRNILIKPTYALLQVSFPFPSGLLLTLPNIIQEDKTVIENNNIYCLLQKNIINLRPNLQNVIQLEDVLSIDLCQLIIEKSEQFAIENDGWSINRHTAYPTTDIPLNSIFGKFSNIHGIVTCSVLPTIAEMFNLNLDYLQIGELFVAKYEYNEGKQSSLAPHIDGTPYSFVINLNSPNQFKGGGTRFLCNNSIYKPTKIGTAVIFSGKNLHEGKKTR